ncbi:LexA family transcriptional repressor [Candidatus Beckwithbacteria bacterium CG10_big_fil_rev_8_21_14_0_10_34_10]|uniref:LexA family transcriptional repressor n=1 Tax=Candidatus Beckwithbacteria bacterium CG10_big_fil_rev_8_21_14_0_10_34_10 TaxID=1974495 RepID=A0A2H0W8V7_9BACT|nr:MAG: LexA family transcriptional repressor [Candidatus Beckwithbacteria bacterium CG10_big_fil_rev_8_21_14_0_10_34_10]
MLEKRLGKLKGFYKRFRRLPSYSEMLQLFNLASKNSVFKLVNKLVELGFLEKERGKLSPGEKFFSSPFLGLVKAGFPVSADEELDLLSLDQYLIEKPQSSFLLKVSGDSLEGIGIFPGDLVIIERKNEASSGEIVLALIDSQWTLKILRKNRNKVVLESANPKYPLFYPENELKIFGVVKGVTRKL